MAPAPYIRDILKGKTKPNIVSWITWTLLTAVATIAEFAAGEYRTAVFTSFACVATAAVVLLGIRRGHLRYSVLDIVCQIGALSGFILWWLFNTPVAAVIAAVSIDFIGAIPSLRHAWKKPKEETWTTFALAGIGAIFGIASLHAFNATSLMYASYIVVINIIFSTIIVTRRRSQN